MAFDGWGLLTRKLHFVTPFGHILISEKEKGVKLNIPACGEKTMKLRTNRGTRSVLCTNVEESMTR